MPKRKYLDNTIPSDNTAQIGINQRNIRTQRTNKNNSYFEQGRGNFIFPSGIRKPKAALNAHEQLAKYYINQAPTIPNLYKAASHYLKSKLISTPDNTGTIGGTVPVPSGVNPKNFGLLSRVITPRKVKRAKTLLDIVFNGGKKTLERLSDLESRAENIYYNSGILYRARKAAERMRRYDELSWVKGINSKTRGTSLLEKPQRINHDIYNSKISKEGLTELFKKYNPSLLAEGLVDSYNNATRSFSVIKTVPSFTNFDARKAIQTGPVTVRDFQTGKSYNFSINPDFGGQQVQGELNPSKPFPVSRNTLGFTIQNLSAPKEYRDLLAKNMDYITQTVLPGSKRFGSISNIIAGNLPHVSHDYDVIMTEAMARKHPNFSSFYSKRPDTYGYDHKIVGPIDVNVIRGTSDNRAVGDLAHELYAQAYPKEYRDLLVDAASRGENINTKIPLPITPEELFSSYDPITKGIFDALASNKQKHINRGLYYLQYGNIDDVEKAFNRYGNYLMGGQYKSPIVTDYDFTNAERNKQLLKSLGVKVNEKDVINDPRRSKLLFDYGLLDKQFFGRGVNAGNPLKDLTYWYPDTYGGTVKGVGLNTVVGGDSGYGDVYGSLIPTRFRQYHGTLSDIEKAIKNNFGIRGVGDNVYRALTKLYNDNGILLPPKDMLPNFAKVLDSTSGRKGQNYKDFINQLAKIYNIPAIQNGNFGYNSNFYASLLEDQPISSIAQIFPKGLDRPISIPARNKSMYSYNSAGQDELYQLLYRLKNIKKAREQQIEYKRGDRNRLQSIEDLLRRREDAANKKLAEYQKSYQHTKAFTNAWSNTMKAVNTARDVKSIAYPTIGTLAASAPVIYAIHEHRKRQAKRKALNRKYTVKVAKNNKNK